MAYHEYPPLSEQQAVALLVATQKFIETTNGLTQSQLLCVQAMQLLSSSKKLRTWGDEAFENNIRRNFHALGETCVQIADSGFPLTISNPNTGQHGRLHSLGLDTTNGKYQAVVALEDSLTAWPLLKGTQLSLENTDLT